MAYCREVVSRLRLLLRNEKGQGLVEYALILVLVAIVIFAMLSGLGLKLGNTYSTINSSVDNAGR